MKILYTQDEHFSGKNSCHYIGDYWEDSMQLLDECIQWYKKLKCEAWISGGDFLESIQIENHLLDEIIDKIEANKIQFFFLDGNHNAYLRNKEYTKIKSSLRHAERRSKNFLPIEYFENLSDEMRAEGYEIKAVDYEQDVEEKIKEEGIQFKDEGQWKIAIVHAMVCPEKFPYASHIIPKDIDTNGDLILCGHYHKEWQQTIGNTQFLNIGCLGRRSITEHTITPKIAILDTNKRNVTTIELTSAKPGEEIFDLSKVQELKAKDQGIENFICSIESASFQATNIKDNIKIIGKEKKVDKEVIDLIINKIGKVK